MIRVGIISTSATRMQKIADSIKTLIGDNVWKLSFFQYGELEEIVDILNHHRVEINGWIFSGPNPYTVAEPHLTYSDSAVFCQVTGDEFYRCMLEKIYEQKSKALRVSIDCPYYGGFHYLVSINQLNIPQESIFLREYHMPVDFSAVLESHLSLWREGKIDTVFTTLYKIDEELRQRSIPVKLISAGDNAIRQAIWLLEEKINGVYFRQSQVGLEIIERRDDLSLNDQAGSSYRLQKLDLEIQRVLLEFAQTINGYLAAMGNGHYEIFASRGLIEGNIAVLYETINRLHTALGIHLSAGIGFGTSVLAAQRSAYQAISYSKSAAGFQIAIIDEDGKITEFVGEEDEITYSATVLDAVILEKLNTANVNVNTYNKLCVVVEKNHWESFTAKQVAQQLGVTERNVQRIFVGLIKAELIVCVGQESLPKKGRPTKKYKINDKF